MKQRRILVVDDEPGIRQSLGDVLEDQAYVVDAVDSGESCLAAAGRAALRHGCPGIRQSLGDVLEDQAYVVDAVDSGESCLAAMPGGGFERAPEYPAAGHRWNVI